MLRDCIGFPGARGAMWLGWKCPKTNEIGPKTAAGPAPAKLCWKHQALHGEPAATLDAENARQWTSQKSEVEGWCQCQDISLIKMQSCQAELTAQQGAYNCVVKLRCSKGLGLLMPISRWKDGSKVPKPNTQWMWSAGWIDLSLFKFTFDLIFIHFLIAGWWLPTARPQLQRLVGSMACGGILGGSQCLRGATFVSGHVGDLLVTSRNWTWTRWGAHAKRNGDRFQILIWISYRHDV